MTGPSRPALLDVTLVAVTSVAIDATVEALRASMEQARFARALLLSDVEPPGLQPAIEWRQIGRLASRSDYSHFMLRELAAHVNTSHALCIQWDGFVLDGNAWDPRFLDFDYIGAPWPHFADGHNVGNGGFSLRSLRLLEACTKLPIQGGEPEDVVISRRCRRELESIGIRFAPDAVARRFAYERTQPVGTEFGFHGAFNLVRRMPRNDAARLFRSLEPGLLAKSERWELLRWSLARGHMGLALNMFKRLV